MMAILSPRADKGLVQFWLAAHDISIEVDNLGKVRAVSILFLCRYDFTLQHAKVSVCVPLVPVMPAPRAFRRRQPRSLSAWNGDNRVFILSYTRAMHLYDFLVSYRRFQGRVAPSGRQI